MLTSKDIEDFYQCFEAQMSPSDKANLDEKLIDQMYEKAVERIKALREVVKANLKQHPESKGVMLPVLILFLEENCKNKVLELLDNRALDECSLLYSKDKIEYSVWA